MSEHDWHRPEGLTYQECRVCGLLKRTDSEIALVGWLFLRLVLWLFGE